MLQCFLYYNFFFLNSTQFKENFFFERENIKITCSRFRATFLIVILEEKGDVELGLAKYREKKELLPTQC